MTRYPDLFGALAEPFDRGEVKHFQKGKGPKLNYITARTAMNRLDEVLGPENWWDEYEVARDNSTLCRLTLRLPDGSTVTKQGLGVRSDSVGEDAEKGGESDSLKRAAAKFGVARYLYRDGVAELRSPEPARPTPEPTPEPSDPREARIAAATTWPDLLGAYLAGLSSGRQPTGHDGTDARRERLVNAMCTAAIAAGHIEAGWVERPSSDGTSTVRDRDRAVKACGYLIESRAAWTREFAVERLREKLREYRADPTAAEEREAIRAEAGA